MNYFHWHLTEDQGWRIEIRKYPLLTEVGSCRSGTIIGHNPGTGDDSTEYCGSYTQDQIKDIVKYAAARYITIIPEIELPGHSSGCTDRLPLARLHRRSLSCSTWLWRLQGCLLRRQR